MFEHLIAALKLDNHRVTLGPPPVPKYNRLSQKGRRKRAKW